MGGMPGMGPFGGGGGMPMPVIPNKTIICF